MRWLQVNRGTTVVPGAVEYSNEAGMPSRLAYGLRDLAVSFCILCSALV